MPSSTRSFVAASIVLPMLPLGAQEWTQITTTTTPPPAIGAAMAFDPNTETMVLFGGQESLNGSWPIPFYDRTWLYDGQGWQDRTPVAGPSPQPRSFHCMASTSETFGTNRVYLYGGIDRNGGLKNQLWSWDGNAWTHHHHSSPPPARYSASMAAYGSGVLIYGGRDNSPNYRDDVWTWHPSSPSWHQSPNGPPGRADATLVQVGRGTFRRIFLHGGSDATRPHIDETWEFDNGNWAQVATAVPLTAHVADVDHANRRMFVTSGAAPTPGGAQEVWRLDENSGWLRVATSNAPPAAEFAAGAIDQARHRIVRFGGLGSQGATAELWEFDSTHPVTVVAPECAARGTAPRLEVSAPAIGSTFLASIRFAQGTALAAVAVGLDDAVAVDLGGVGAPGCVFRHTPIVTRLHWPPVSGVGYGMYLSLPADPAIAGIELAAQGLVFDGLGVAGATEAWSMRLF